MNNKERLEEIKKHRDEAENSIDEYEFEKINFYNLHVDWLIEQAERVQEYDRELISLEDNKHYVSEMLAKNKRYREAIERALGESGWGDEGNALYRTIGILTKALEGEE